MPRLVGSSLRVVDKEAPEVFGNVAAEKISTSHSGMELIQEPLRSRPGILENPSIGNCSENNPRTIFQTSSGKKDVSKELRVRFVSFEENRLL